MSWASSRSRSRGETLFAGNLTVVNLSNNTAISATPISDGLPGASSRMLEADDNTLWIAMTKCNNGVRAATGQAYGCLTMFNTAIEHRDDDRAISG